MVGESFTMKFYSILVAGIIDDVFGESLDVEMDKLTTLFQRNFGTGLMDNSQKSQA